MAETKKYLDYAGLKTYHEKAKSEYDGKYALKGEAGNVDLSEYTTDTEVDEKIKNTYLGIIDVIWGPIIKEEYEQYINQNGWVDFNQYVTRNPSKANEVLRLFNNYDYDLLNTDIYSSNSYLLTTTANLLNGLIDVTEQTYAKKSEVVDLDTLKQVVAEAPHIKKEKVETLPPEADGVENVLYLVPRSNTEDGNYYDQYLLIDGKWDPIGSTKTNLANYISKDEEVDFYEDGSLTVMDAIYEAYSEAKKAKEQFRSLEEQIYAGENNFYGQFLKLKDEVAANTNAELESISNQEIDALFA